MPVSDLARVTISTVSQLITRVGFGTPMIIGCCNAWAASASPNDRSRLYSSLAGLVADGFAITDPEYLAAQALLSQPNPPPTFKLGRRALKPTQQWVITPSAVNNAIYQLTIDGQVATFTADGTATVAEIVAGLKTAVDALSLALTTTNEGPGNDLKIVANAAGAFHTLSAMRADIPTAPNPNIDVKQNHADPGIATDLAAILAADSNWYGGMLTFQGAAEILAAAAWFEANGPRIFFADTQDSGVYATGSGSIRTSLKNAGYLRTALMREQDNGQFRSAAWMGFGLPTDPGTENWANMPLDGQTPETYTAAQQAFMEGEFCNYFYSPASGLTATRKGVVSGGEYIDVVRFRDAFQINAEEDLAQVIASAGAEASKISYDDAGIAKFENALRARVKAGQDVGAIETNPAPVFAAPLASTISATDRKNRVLNGLSVSFQLTGAINLVNVTATVS